MKRAIALFFTVAILLACSLPGRISTLLATSTPFPGPTDSPMPTASKTRWPTITYTPAATLTPTVPTNTPTFTPIPPTPTQTVTPIPPSLTPGANEFTAGQDAWRLTSIQLVDTIFAWSVDVTPYIFNRSPWGYRFLRMDFECLTERSLISLYSGVPDDGLTLVYRRTGYPDIYVIDSVSRTFHVGILGRCWLAATVPADSHGFTLYFANLPPFIPLTYP